MIIDAHCHRFPGELSADPDRWSSAHGEPHWGRLTAPGGKGKPLQGWADSSKHLADMDLAGVDRAVLMAWYWQKPENCAVHNTWHQTWLRETPDRLFTFAAFHAGGGQTALDDTLRALETGGARGVGELCPPAQGYAWDDPWFHKLLTWCELRGAPVNLHVTEPVGRPHPGAIPTPFPELLRLAETFPRLKLILSHWGGGLLFQELQPWVRQRLANVSYDSSATHLVWDDRVHDNARQTVGAQKLLFGTDYPLRVLPKDPASPDYVGPVTKARAATAGFSEQEREAFFGGNLLRLLPT